MTAEVVVCNTLGLALAADSAATVNNKVLNSANKLFALTKSRPVGVMINGGSALSSIPWEVLIKEYRGHLKDRGFPHLRLYAEDFFQFINSNSQFFDKKYIELEIRNKIKMELDAAVDDIIASTSTPRTSIFRQRAEFGRLIDKFYNAYLDISNHPYISGIDKKRAETYFSTMLPVYNDIATNYDNIISSTTRRNRLLQIMNSYLVKQAKRPAVSSLVFAGFGEKDVFPQVCQFQCDGFFGNVVWRMKGIDHGITSLNRAAIFPFAQDDVVKTFIDGIEPELYTTVVTFVREFANSVKGVVNPSAAALIDGFLNKFFSDFDLYRNERHVAPLIDMVAVLPVDELAQLAESLVSITSLKRHVSQDMETVGGPIDVAVISRGDGMVWVKRKHYFEPSLNPDYFARQRVTRGQG